MESRLAPVMLVCVFVYGFFPLLGATGEAAAKCQPVLKQQRLWGRKSSPLLYVYHVYPPDSKILTAGLSPLADSSSYSQIGQRMNGRNSGDGRGPWSGRTYESGR